MFLQIDRHTGNSFKTYAEQIGLKLIFPRMSKNMI